jgi:hypothetical protein
LYKAIKTKWASLKGDKIAIEEYGEKLDSIPKFLGLLFEQFLDSYNLNLVLKRLELQGGELDLSWPSKAFTELCGQMDWYRSTEWIRSENHAERIGEYQRPQTLVNRIRTYEQFRFEKILIISEDVSESLETSRWLWKVFSIKNEYPDRKITILVTQEKAARKAEVDPMFFDMGIYKIGNEKPFMGFLDHTKAKPLYKWRLEDDTCFKRAEKAFADLGKVAEPSQSIIAKMLSRQFSEPLQETSARDKNKP